MISVLNHRQQLNGSKMQFMKKTLVVFVSFLLFGLVSNAQTLSKKDTSEVKFLNSRKFYIYKVEKGETLFNISQKFGIPQDEILQFNSDVKANGLKAKMKVWVPAYSWLNKDSANTSTKNVVKPVESKRHKVAVVTAINLPKLYLEKNPGDSTYVDEPVDKEIIHNVDFIESIKFAFQSLASNSEKIDLTILDDESDTMKIGSIIKGDVLYSAIITNETGAMLKKISAICQNRNIKLISSGINTTDILFANKNALSLMPSSLTQCQMAGYFATEYFNNATALFIKTTSSKENERTAAFKKGWTARNHPYKQSDYSKEKIESITDSLSKTKNTVIFIPSSNEDMVTTLLSNLKDKKDSGYKFCIMGLPTWQSFETVDPKLMEQTNVYIFNSGQINYNSPEVTTYRKHFRDQFNKEPGEMAMQGYDAAMLYMNLLKENGSENLTKKLPEVKGLFTDYVFDIANNGISMENKVIHVFKAGDDESDDLAKKVQWK